jgi:hypothetical protein
VVTTRSPGSEAARDLDPVAAAGADLELAELEGGVADRHERDRALAVTLDGRRRDVDAFARLAGAAGEEDLGEHAGLERAVGVGESDPHLDRARPSIEHGADRLDGAVEGPPGPRLDRGHDLLADCDLVEVALVDVDLHPDGAEVHDDEHGVLGLDHLAERHRPLDDDAGQWRADPDRRRVVLVGA